MTFQRVLMRLFRTLGSITVGCFLLLDQISNILTFKIPAEILEVSSALSSVLLSKFNPSLVNFIINKEKFQIQLLAVLGDGRCLCVGVTG